MNHVIENGVLKVFLSGHIDSSNAPATESEIFAIRDEQPHEAMILDLRELSYISSAGLRIVLRLRKAEPELKLTNVSPEVYEIFSMTGFTEMMPVEKAYRNISIEGCEAIGRGANGTVYRIDKDTVVKVYNNPDCLADVQRERELARKAFVLGIPTAIPYDVVRVGEQFGSVFELLNSKSFSKLIAANPEKIDQYVDLFVDLLHKLHSTHIKPGEMPNMKALALEWAEIVREQLPEAYGKKLYDLVNAVPDTDTLLHGDYHTNNIVMQNDEVLIIDMDTLCVGHPIFELASIYLAFVGFGELDPTIVEAFLKLPYATTRLFWQKALRRYLGTLDEAVVRSVEEKAMVISYTRLMRRTIRRNGLHTEDGRKIIDLCARRLVELLDRLDSLYF